MTVKRLPLYGAEPGVRPFEQNGGARAGTKPV